MKAVILAGGEGTRLRPLTSTRPKPMVKVVGKPVLQHVISLLESSGMKDFIITLHYLPDDIRSYFNDGSNLGVSISYKVEEDPLGTAGSVKNVEEYLDETFLVISGDVLTDINLSEVLHFHRKSGALVTIAITRVPDPVQYGIIMVDEDSHVTRFLEKPAWGEVFTDTVNAGIYVIEPEVLKHVETGKEVDFSKNLFPFLLSRGEPIFGYLTRGYWCDIGTIQQYLQANYDALNGKVKLKIPGRKVGDGVWMGEGVDVSRESKIVKPVFIGDDCIIGGGVTVGDSTVLCDGVTVDEKAVIKRSVLLDKTSVGFRAELIGCVVGERCSIDPYASIFEEVAVGDDSKLGKRCVVKSGVRIWPDKLIEAGSTVDADVRWGIRWMRNLFGAWGITGSANVEVTPELAAKLGTALGTFFGRGAQVAVARDTHRASRMVKRGLVSGLASAGVNVINLKIAPAPVLRYFIANSGINGGISFRVPVIDPRSVNIQVYDSEGINLGPPAEKKIQEIFFKGDIRRVLCEEIGTLIYPVGFDEMYCKALTNFIDTKSIKKRNLRVVLDCSNGSGSLLVPQLFNDLGCEVVPLNTRIDEFATRLSSPITSSLKDLSKVVRSSEADIGIFFDADADRIVFVDEAGTVVAGDTALATVAKEVLLDYGAGKVVVPVTASKAIDLVAEKCGGTVIRTKLGAYHLTYAAKAQGAVFGGEESGAYIIPKFQKSYDGIATAAKIVENMCKNHMKLSEMVMGVPVFAKAQESVACPWKFRGTIMRTLVEESRGHQIDMLEGLKIFHDSNWVAIIPVSEEPVMKLYAEAVTGEEAKTLTTTYSSRVKELIEFSKP